MKPATVNIGEKTYEEVDVTTTPYLGKLQTYAEAYIVSDKAFEELKSQGSLIYIYNYRLENPGNIEASRPWLQELVQRGEEGMTGVSYTEDSLNEDSYIRVTYSLCLFMFVTLMLAAGSIIFLKIGNEAYEDRERYEILEKMGIPRKTLGKAVRNEICFAYYCPFLLMTISSYFSVRALGRSHARGSDPDKCVERFVCSGSFQSDLLSLCKRGKKKTFCPERLNKNKENPPDKVSSLYPGDFHSFTINRSDRCR